MTDLQLDAARHAFEHAFREHVLRYHPEQDTAFVRDQAARCFTRKLAERLQVLPPPKELTFFDRAKIAQSFRPIVNEAYRKIKAGLPARDVLSDCLDELQKLVAPTLF